MKKLLLGGCLMMAGSFSVLAAPTSVTVDGGAVTFKGNVVAAPCVIDNSQSSLAVDMGQVMTKSLASKGSTTGAVPFIISLTGCDLTDPANAGAADNYTSASVAFTGSNAGTPDVLAISSASGSDVTASGVGIQIMHNNQPVKVDGSKGEKNTISAGSNKLTYQANYIAITDKVVAGAANATASFKITYE